MKDTNTLIEEMFINDNFNNSFIGKAFAGDVLSDEDMKLIEQSENGNKVTEFFSSVGEMVSSTFNFKRYGGKVYTYDFPSIEGETIADTTESIKDLIHARLLQGDDKLKSVSYLGKAIAYGMNNFSEEDIDLIVKNTDLQLEKSINDSVVITERDKDQAKSVSNLRRPDPKETEEVESEEPNPEEELIEEPTEAEEEPITDEPDEEEEVIEVPSEVGDTELILSIDSDLSLTEYELGKIFMVEIDLVFTKNTSDVWKFAIFVGKNNKIYIWKIETLLKSDTKKFYTELLDLVTYVVNENWGEFQSNVPDKLLDIFNLTLTSEPMKYIKAPIVKFVNSSITDPASVKKANMNYIILSSCVVQDKVNDLGDVYLVSTINGVLKSVVTKKSDGEYEINEGALNSESLKKFMFACIKVDKTKKTLMYSTDKDTNETPVESEFLANITPENPKDFDSLIDDIATLGLTNLLDENVYTDALIDIFELGLDGSKEALYKSERKKAFLKLLSLVQDDISELIVIPEKYTDIMEIEQGNYDMFGDIEYNLDDALQALTIINDTDTRQDLLKYLSDDYVSELDEVETSEYIPNDSIISIYDLMRLPKDKSFDELADNQYIDGFIKNFAENFGSDVDANYKQATNLFFKKLLFELYDNEDTITFDGYKMSDKIRNIMSKYDQYDDIYGDVVVSGENEGEPMIYDSDEVVDAINILKSGNKNNDLKDVVREFV